MAAATTHDLTQLDDPAEADLLSAPDTDRGRLQRIALNYLHIKERNDEIPTSIRFIFYELEQQGVVSKRVICKDGKEGVRKPAQYLTEAVTHLREVSLIPWDWLTDDTREVHDWYSAPTVAEFMAEQVELARINPWVGVPRPVIITESRTVGGVLARGIAQRYLTPVAPTSGQTGGFLVTDLAPLLADPTTRVQYLGDYDLAGNQIEANTKRVLERHTGRVFTADTWERVALTDAQVRRLKARGVEPIVKEDRRYDPPRRHEAFEAEAFGQRQLVAILRDRLDKLIPEPLKDVLEREAEQRAGVLRLLRRRRI
jgi:hypothetical protein